MNNPHPKPKETPICHCSGTTQTKIEELIANDIKTLEEIATLTGATTGCGACDYLVLELLAQSK